MGPQEGPDVTHEEGACAFVSRLRAHGWAVLPAPRSVELPGGLVRVGPEWALVTEGLDAGDTAVRLLADDYGFQPGPAADAPGIVRLVVLPGAVATGAEPACEAQAYRLCLAPDRIEIVGNSRAGLFYGVQTLWQLLDDGPAGPGVLPRGTIVDWPRWPLRIAHWCTNSHQDRMETLTRYLDWTARFKLNAISFDFEDRFAYPSHPVIGVPEAFTPEQLRELTAYGLARHVQIIPNVQAPAHMSYVLKHEEFAHLRCDGSNYIACMGDPAARQLIFDMYQDLIDATPGVEYFHVSVDELYYAGICERFRKPYNPWNRSLTYVDFVNAAHAYLSARGRKVLIWGEFPLLTEHVRLLPPDLIDAIAAGDARFLEEEHARGIRPLVYQPIQGAEHLVPNYFPFHNPDGSRKPGHLAQGLEACSPRGKLAGRRILGVFAAAWDNSGLHNELFWLGWAAMAQYGWNADALGVEQTVADFFDLYHGRGCGDLAEVYRHLQAGARFYENTWEQAPSQVRPPAYGSSKGKRPTLRRDLTLAAPALPVLPDLARGERFRERCAAVLAGVPAQLEENERIRRRLQAAFTRVRRNRYHLHVLLALAEFERHHLHLLLALAEADRQLDAAGLAHGEGRHDAARQALTSAGTAVGRIVQDLYATYERIRTVWEVSMLPRNRSTAARRYVPSCDDVKDYFAHRRSDLTYLIAPEESIGLRTWLEDLAGRVTAYAREHGLGQGEAGQPPAEE
jgi:hypothetical protein